MRGRDCLCDLEKESKPLAGREPAIPAVFVDAFALDILKDQVRLSIGGHSGIQQAGNVRMIERIENVALASEPLTEQAVSPASSGKFECHRTGQQAVATLGHPDFGHSALANFSNQTPWSDRVYRRTLKLLGREFSGICQRAAC